LNVSIVCADTLTHEHINTISGRVRPSHHACTTVRLFAPTSHRAHATWVSAAILHAKKSILTYSSKSLKIQRFIDNQQLAFCLPKSNSLNHWNMRILYFIDDRGYLRFADSGRLVHRWAAEKKIGRKLKEGEVVHHIDRNKLNNRSSNLFVCKNQNHHWHLHVIDARNHGWDASLGFVNKNHSEKIRKKDTKRSESVVYDLVSLFKFMLSS
jgi:hypothetical protein